MFLSRLFQQPYPNLDWIQVEVSSYCNGSCVYCPHYVYRRNWNKRHLPIESFQNLAPAFAKTKLIYLQGWGEPFTHPHFFDMVHLAKKAGCMVGTTTNGTLLNQASIEKLVAEGLDIITFSLAGVDEKNDSIRKGTRITKVLNCIEATHKARNKYGTDTPKVHIAYMLLRSGLSDLEKLPTFLSNTGADQTVVSSLSLAVTPGLEEEASLATEKTECLDLQNRLIEVREASATLGAEVHFHITSPSQAGFNCSENCSWATVIGSDGSVSPCVMKQLPVKEETFYYFNEQKQLLQHLIFGDIVENPLNTIWHRKEYRKFKRAYRRGKTPPVCRNCLKQFSDSLQPSFFSPTPYRPSLDLESVLSGIQSKPS